MGLTLPLRNRDKRRFFAWIVVAVTFWVASAFGYVYTDIPIPAGWIIPSASHIANNGSLYSGLLINNSGGVNNGEFALFVYNQSGQTNLIPLPAVTYATVGYSEDLVILSNNVVVVAGMNPFGTSSGGTIYEYQLGSESPVPASATLVNTIANVGSAISRTIAMVKFTNNAVAVAFVDQSNKISADLIYRKTSGTWTNYGMTFLNVTEPPGSNPNFIAAAENIGDHSLWIFTTQDGSGTFWGAQFLTFSNSTDGLFQNQNTTVSTLSGFPVQLQPYTEISIPQAISDTFRNRILLGYNNNNYTNLNGNPFTRATYMTLAGYAQTNLTLLAQSATNMGLLFQFYGLSQIGKFTTIGFSGYDGSSNTNHPFYLQSISDTFSGQAITPFTVSDGVDGEFTYHAVNYILKLSDGNWHLLLIQGTNYYVDPVAGNDSNDGLTESTAWAHLPGTIGGGPAIQLQPGATVLVKGGSTNTVSVNFDDTTYHGSSSFDSIVVQSGHLANPAWGSGRAIFDEQNTRFYGFGVGKGSGNPIQGLTLDGFEIRNIAGAASSGAPGNPGSCCISIQPPPSGGVNISFVTVRNCYLHDAIRTVNDTGHGMEIGCTFQMLIYHNQVGPNIGTKGIEFSGSTGVVSNNFITSTGDHCMSATRATNFDVTANLIVQDFHTDGSSTVHGPTYMIGCAASMLCDFWNNVGYNNYSGFTSNGWSRAVGWYNSSTSNRWVNNSFSLLGDNQDNSGAGSSFGMGANAAGTTDSFNQYINNIQLNWTNPSGNAFIIYNGNPSFDNNANISLNFNDWFNGASTTVCGWNDGSYHYSTLAGFSFAPVTSFSGNQNLDPILTGGTLPSGLDSNWHPNTLYFQLNSAASPSIISTTRNTVSGDSTHGYSSNPSKFALDITGITRSFWSMGAYELTTGGSGAATNPPVNVHVQFIGNMSLNGQVQIK